MCYVAPPYAWVFFGSLCTYLASVWLLKVRLERHHPTVWQVPFDNSVREYTTLANWLRFGRLFFFGLSPDQASDRSLRMLVWTTRLLLALTMTLMVAGFATHTLPVGRQPMHPC